MTKMTKREMFEAMISGFSGGDFAFETADGVVAVSPEQFVEFAQKEITLLDNKAAKAKERAAAKRAEADELMEVVQSLLTDEFQTAADIAAQIEGEDVSAAKVVARLGKLVAAEVAVKDDIKVVGADGKKSVRKGYRKLA